MSTTKIGIDDIAFATSHYVLDLAEIALNNHEDVAKYYVGIGQSEMSVSAEDEDIVTMAADAALQILARHEKSHIRTLLMATETGIDQSKSAGVFVHSLLNLSKNCRVVELKQACYSATAALQFALGIVARDPSEAVLVVASDIARYKLHTSAEATQGAGAVAMLVKADPAIIAIEPTTGVYTDDIHDFWRPNYMSEALVDGKFSMEAYLTALEHSWHNYLVRGGSPINKIDRFCYHQPFTKMAVKAQTQLRAISGLSNDGQACLDQLAGSLEINRRIGNSYTASMYMGFLSLLNNDGSDLSGSRVGFFSYGSGSVAEFFSGIIQDNYDSLLRRKKDISHLNSRVSLTYEQYKKIHTYQHSSEGFDFVTPDVTRSSFRFAGVQNHMRLYEIR